MGRKIGVAVVVIAAMGVISGIERLHCQGGSMGLRFRK
jgi:hypothetical protein